jgi:plastocyanin
LAFRFSPGEDDATSQAGIDVRWPLVLRIEQGTSLVFENLDPVAHTLTSDTCADGAGFEEPQAPPPLNALADVFDDEVGPAVFGEQPVPEPSGPCLFDSRGANPNGFTAQGTRSEVDTTRLPPGEYAFHCVIHDFMQGTLQVVADEHPAPRPDEPR